ncbi:calpain-2 catalytic subunit-like isoform X2 [Denticeps clupeoides]|uniref:calpain-2 catalytic subunit-like isoform X2 n=1 Tax=Denticeps clupeoides TaxID=299321 RepID=UPI0010A54EC9|nr:calpain-2 catalytic subunit-like isoform X2 [Denticeps clupeoides]
MSGASRSRAPGRGGRYLGQDYRALRQKCLENGELFRDKAFDAVPASLGYKELGPNSALVQGVEWKRPWKICSSPKFISEGATRTDICQGELGDCWLLVSVASITLQKDVLARVVPQDQSFQTDYAGIFHFQFWQEGEWVDVVVDDRLPVKDGRLLFVHSADCTEFWSALLEKAYAKVSGCYESLKGGLPSESLTDFTGGIVEVYELHSAPSYLYAVMMRAMRLGSLLATFTMFDSTLNLVDKHAYSITGVQKVHLQGTTANLVRLRNPWGHKEWRGAWSDNSREWDLVEPEERKKLNYSADDGEFWMAFSDFKDHFSEVHICNRTPDTSDDLSHWRFSQFNGVWKAGSTAGGNREHKATFCNNPQFAIELGELDSEPHDGVEGCSLLVGLIQKNTRRMKMLGQELSAVGFSIYRVPQEYVGQSNITLGRDVLLRQKPVAVTDPFEPRREICKRFTLPPAEYVLVPSTALPDQEGGFLLRVFYKKMAFNRKALDI